MDELVKKTFVCAFRGRRDDYQVPIALYEISALDCLITDFYASNYLLKIRSRYFKFENRNNQLLPGNKVINFILDSIATKVYSILGYKSSRIYSNQDKKFSIKSAQRAHSRKTNLFLYTPYAWEAFTFKYDHHPQKILFQYHPHGAFEREILLLDKSRYPEFGFSIDDLPDSGLNLSDQQRERYEEVWRFSDKIICASTFTKQSLVSAGAADERCFVVPYGINVKAVNGSEKLFDEFTFLFVGSGIQRKGLHVLLKAWEHAKIYTTAKLVIVSRHIEKKLEDRIAEGKNITVLNNIDNEQLTELYSRSHLFVLPSLVEGFGQVFLEALSCGCPVLGTPNTCLPDLGSEKEGIFLVEAGNYRALADKLIYLRQLLEVENHRRAANETAQQFTWERFRRGIQKVVSIA
jgi:glycosyltransferase involved in cell wall biosynthesis